MKCGVANFRSIENVLYLDMNGNQRGIYTYIKMHQVLHLRLVLLLYFKIYKLGTFLGGPVVENPLVNNAGNTNLFPGLEIEMPHGTEQTMPMYHNH